MEDLLPEIRLRRLDSSLRQETQPTMDQIKTLLLNRVNKTSLVSRLLVEKDIDWEIRDLN
jgi:hypothetical protein